MQDRPELARFEGPQLDQRSRLSARVVGWVKRSRDELRLRWLGADFDDRMRELRTHYQTDRFDPLGLDLSTFEGAARLCAFFHRAYFRTEVHGIDHIPKGRVLIVANHSGQIPIDAAIIGCALFFDAREPRVVRALVDRWAASLPFVSAFFSRLGSVVGAPSNAERLLSQEEAVLVFPEGIRGISKPFAERYQLQEFGHGFIRIALAAGCPILPLAVIGAEEQYVNVGNSTTLARLLGWPVCPLIPQILLPMGQMPLPTKYRLHFGEPLLLSGDPRESESLVGHKAYLVRQAVQSLLTAGLAQRRGVFG